MAWGGPLFYVLLGGPGSNYNRITGAKVLVWFGRGNSCLFGGVKCVCRCFHKFVGPLCDRPYNY